MAIKILVSTNSAVWCLCLLNNVNIAASCAAIPLCGERWVGRVMIELLFA